MLKKLHFSYTMASLSLQDFLLGRVIPADKEVCNPFFLATFTQISVAVSNLATISIKIAAPYSESAHQSINVFVTIFVMAIFGWLVIFHNDTGHHYM